MYVYSIYVKYFYIVLREFSDNGQWRSKHIV
jgi:hypothetical protein